MNNTSKQGPSATGARRAALYALEQVFARRRMLGKINAGRGVEASDAARAQRLCLGVLRHLSQIDRALQPFTERTPQVRTRCLLRLGAYELLFEGEAAYGVIDSFVDLAKRDRQLSRGAGFVNAVLRKVAELPPAEPQAQRLPPWIRKPLVKTHGQVAVETIEAAHLAGGQVDVTPRGPDITLPGRALPTGSSRLEKGAQVSALPGYQSGDFWVQDTAAALPVRALAGLVDLSGAAVLDLCAAPGGKTMQLASLGAQVTALDISEPRLGRLRENLTRTGLQAEIVCADAFTWTGRPFDAVLIDAPCSATGTIRRHPELPFIRTGTEVETLTRLQMRLIDRAKDWLKPGGILLYCTCSLLPNEGENQVKAALGRHQDLGLVPIDAVALGGEAHWQSPAGGLRLRPDFWPEIGGMDGFYICALRKTSGQA
ncbi:MAG: transcription antitermination factor NusB [Pseudomonadota bacterium]